MTLHQRIKEFEKVNSEIGKFFESVKWVGNEGSHQKEALLGRADVMDAYKIFEFSLKNLVDETREVVSKLSKKINENKGILKK